MFMRMNNTVKASIIFTNHLQLLKHTAKLLMQCFLSSITHFVQHRHLVNRAGNDAAAVTSSPRVRPLSLQSPLHVRKNMGRQLV